MEQMKLPLEINITDQERWNCLMNSVQDWENDDYDFLVNMMATFKLILFKDVREDWTQMDEWSTGREFLDMDDVEITCIGDEGDSNGTA